MNGLLEILCVGDVHGQWDDVDRNFVESGTQDVLLFVGDLGHNDLEIVRTIAALRCEKFVLLGNHDAWDDMLGGPRETAAAAMDLLGDSFGGYAAKRIAGGSAAVVGCRPFSWGGSHWESHYGPFYEHHLGTRTDASSASRIVAAAKQTGDVPLILVGHQGPAGLGDGRDAIFGRDFAMPHTDFGDRDFRLAIDALRQKGRRVIATVAGHMHDRLVGGGRRVRACREEGTLHVNAAVVPRHVRRDGQRLRHYVRLRVDGRGAEAWDVWIDDGGAVARTEALEAG